MTDSIILTPHKKIAIVLFQLGGPDSLEAIEPFLYNLFMDPDIIDFPFAFLARQPLAKYISSKRSPKVQENYKQIGGKSPILKLTQQQASALESQLNQQGLNSKVFIAMRYWHPMIEEVVKEIKSAGFEQLILLPLYPQFSRATTHSSFNEWNRQAKKYCLKIPTKLVCCYPNQFALIDAFVDNINKALTKFVNVAPEEIDLVFSAHGVPVSYIEKGDPYQLHVEETVRCIVKRGSWKSPHILCYQSKVGPVKWLKPSLAETVEILAGKGRKHLLIIPAAFVTEHIETLHEINIEVRKHAMAHGVHKFEMMPALNDHPKFIQCLAELVQSQFTSGVHTKTCEIPWQINKERPKPKLCCNYLLFSCLALSFIASVSSAT